MVDSEKQRRRKKKSRFARFIQAISPLRILSKARDFYVMSMLGCASSRDWSAMTGSMGYSSGGFLLATSAAADDDEEVMNPSGSHNRSLSYTGVIESQNRGVEYRPRGARIRAAIDEHRLPVAADADLGGRFGVMAPTRKLLGSSWNGRSGYCIARIGTIDEDKPSDFSGDQMMKAIPCCRTNYNQRKTPSCGL